MPFMMIIVSNYTYLTMKIIYLKEKKIKVSEKLDNRKNLGYLLCTTLKYINSHTKE